METIKDMTQLCVTWNDVNTAGVEGNTISAYSDLNDGEVVACDAKNLVLTASNNLVAADFPQQQFKLVWRAGTELKETGLIGQGQITGYNLSTQLVEIQQVDYVGSNGVTGSLGTLTSNIHTIRLYILEATIMGFMQQKIKEGFYKSGSTTTEAAIALGLNRSLVANYSREPEQDLKFERVNDGSRTAVPTSADNFVFVKGSKYFTATDIDDATGTAALVVGDLLVIGTAVTSPVYKITAIDTATNTGTLDMEFQGTSATIADTALKVIVVAQEAEYGIKITGVDQSFKAGFNNPDPITWKTTIDFGDSSTTAVIETTAAFPGIGTAQKVANLEKQFAADNHVYRTFVEDTVVDDKQVTAAALVAGTLYDMITIDYYDSIDSGMGHIVKSPKQLIIASAGTDNLCLEDADSGVIVALDKIIVTNWATPGAAVLEASLS